MRWLALEGCPVTHPRKVSERTSARSERIYFSGRLDLRGVREAPGLAGRRWFALAGCHMTLPLFFWGLGAERSSRVCRYYGSRGACSYYC